MGVIAAAAGAIAGAIASAATAIASVVSSIVSWVVGAVGSIVSAIGSAIGSVVGVIVEAATAVYDFVASAVSAITGTVAADAAFVGGEVASTASMYGYYVGSMVAYYFSSLVSYASTIYSVVSTLYETLHLDTVMKVHNIAYMVSDDYRSTVNKIYDEIGEVSRVLGYGAEFLGLVFRDARNIILDVSAVAGRKYDLAEVAWMEELHKYFHKFADNVDRYRANPGQLFWDIDQWMIRSNVDTKAAIFQSLYTNLMSVTELIRGTVETVDKFREDLGKLIADLPSFIRKEVEPMLGPILEEYDKFIKIDYKPTMTRFDRIMGTIVAQQKEQTTEVDGLVNRLKRPGDYLSEIERFPKAERERQEKQVAEIASKPYDEQASEVAESLKPRIYRLNRIAEALKKELPPIEWEAGEVVTPQRPAKTPIEPRKTWFVGEF